MPLMRAHEEMRLLFRASALKPIDYRLGATICCAGRESRCWLAGPSSFAILPVPVVEISVNRGLQIEKTRVRL